MIIAIDGPAASGKSSVSKRVAAQLGILYVNSGAMYRAFTWYALKKGIDPSNVQAVLILLQKARFESSDSSGSGTISIDGFEPEATELGSPEVNGSVSVIAAIPEVRQQLVAAQRSFGDHDSVVMEGRDIGTVVFPDADYKFYINASVEVREARRRAEGIVDQIAARDQKDSTRKASPLTIADDAIVIDNSMQTLDETVDSVLSHIRA